MSNRTTVHVDLYDCPAGEREAAAAVLAVIGWDGEPAAEGALPGPRVAWDIGADLAEEMFMDLIDAAPGASFRVWTEPVEGQLGALHAWTPGLGAWWGPCDADGSPLATWAAGERLPGRRVLGRRLGRPWGEHYAAALARRDARAG